MTIVSEAFEKIVTERTWTIKNFLESERNRLTGENTEQRLEALKDLVTLLKTLPNHALTEKEVVHLLEYFSSAMLSFTASSSICIDAVYFLVMRLKSFPFGQELHLHNSFFVENLICDFTQSDRLKLLKILYHLLLNDWKAFLPHNDEFVRSFIRGTQGEVDPECLMLVFKLFFFISKNFQLGLFVDDFFEVIACYYPIVFEPLSKSRDAITRPMLVNACEQCLLSNKKFGPFTFQLLVEKLLDDDIKEVEKTEICSFLCTVCDKFDVSVLLDQLDDVLGALRTFAFESKSRNTRTPLPKPVLDAVDSIIQKLIKSADDDGRSVIHLCDNLIENCEPFVLEADLGLTSRALELCKTVYRSTASITQKFIEAVFQWLVQLSEGRTVHTIADRDEVMRNSIIWLVEWCEIASEFKNESLVIKYYDRYLNQLITSPETSKEINYKLAEILLTAMSDNNLVNEFCQRLFNDSFIDILNLSLRPMCTSFIKKFAQYKWEDLCSLIANVTATSENQLSIALICSYALSSYDNISFVFNYINGAFTMDNLAKNDSVFLNSLLDMFITNKRDDLLCMELFKRIVALFSNLYDDSNIPVQHAALFQDIGLILSPANHEAGLDLCFQSLLRNKRLVQLYYLIILQSSNTKYLHDICEISFHKDELNKYKVMFAGSIINKTHYRDSEECCKIDEFVSAVTGIKQQRCSGFICKMLLLNNSSLGLCYLRRLFNGLDDDNSSAECLQEILDVLNFEDRECDPEKCRYNHSKLWRQQIVCQFISVYLEYYNAVGDNKSKISKLLQLLWPLLIFAEPLADYAVVEFKQLTVVINGFLERRLNCESERSILKALYYFLKLDSKVMRLEFPVKAILFLKDNIINSEVLEVRLYAIKCLRLLMKYFSEADLLEHRNEITYSLIEATGSKKRVIRVAAAEARNAWECFFSKQKD